MIVRQLATHAVFQPEKMSKSDILHGESLFCGLNSFEPGQRHATHTHRDQDKLYVVLEGAGEVQIGSETQRIAAGDAALAPAGVEHSMANPGPERLVVMVVMAPPPPRARG